MSEPKSAAERAAHKKQLISTLLVLEVQINANLESPKLLSELRADYRRYHDELSMYYDDDPAERITVTK